MGLMFTPAERSELQAELITRARADPSISGAALVGSVARDAEDEWSDIDLVLQLAPGVDEPSVVKEWTSSIDALGRVADVLDVIAGGVRYRVFLLVSSLQIDVSFWPHDEFRATEPGFRLLFGKANKPTDPVPVNMDRTIGMGWLYAIHARSAVARGRTWQATMMLDELRTSLITLMCIRADVNPWHGRDVDRLPPADLAALVHSRAVGVGGAELELSRQSLTHQFFEEIKLHDPVRAARLESPFEQLCRPVR